MRCATAQLFLSRRLDGRLASADARALDEHLSGCAGCHAQAAQLAGTWERLRTASDRPPAPQVWAGIMARLEERGRWRVWLETLGWRTPAAGPAFASLMAVIALGIGGGALLGGRLQFQQADQPIEVVAFAEAFGELPADSPAALLLGTIGDDHPARMGR